MAKSNIIPVSFGENASKGAVVDRGNNSNCDNGYDYDHQCDLMREKNQRYLDLFEADMRAHGLAESTIRRHLNNVDFYINVYLLHYDVNDMEYGCHDIDGFLGDFFIRKCMWSTPGTIKTNAASIKKFYKYMREKGFVGADAYDELVCTIKENMAEWQDDCATFNDPANYDNPFLNDFGNIGRLEDSDNVAFRSATDPEAFLDVNSKLEVYFKEALKEILEQQIVNEFGSDLDRAASAVRDALPKTFASPEQATREEVIDVFALALFYLTSWEEKIGGKKGFTLRKAWKSADWDSLDRLREADLIDCTNKAKSLTLTAEGTAQAELFLQALALGHLVKE